MPRYKVLATAGMAVIAAGLLAACSSSSPPGQGPAAAGGSGPIKVLYVDSLSGALGAYGPPMAGGFKAGLSYLTHGTNTVDGRKLDIQYVNDSSVASTALTAATTAVGQGTQIVMGGNSSDVCGPLSQFAAQNNVLYITGACGDDSLTGANKNTFRSQEQTYQSSEAFLQDMGDIAGKSVVVLAQDTAYGQSVAKTSTQAFTKAGAKVTQILAAETATDLTPYALKVKQSGAQVVYVNWTGTNKQLYDALAQQGVFGSADVYSLLNLTAGYEGLGANATKVHFVADYFPGASGNATEAG